MSKRFINNKRKDPLNEEDEETISLNIKTIEKTTKENDNMNNIISSSFLSEEMKRIFQDQANQIKELSRNQKLSNENNDKLKSILENNNKDIDKLKKDREKDRKFIKGLDIQIFNLKKENDQLLKNKEKN